MSFEIILSPDTSRSSVMETRAVCAVAAFSWKHQRAISFSFKVSNAGVKNHFTITFRVNTAVEEYGSNYPIS
jgi:hypothetical protein